MQLSLSDIVSISVSQTPAGVNAFNTSNLAIFTSESAGGGFGSNGYKLYMEPTTVGTDFGTGSTTFKMANAIFSQQPNILSGGGALIVITLNALETLDAAITRTKGLVSYFGVLATAIQAQADMLAAAAVIQPLAMMGFFPQKTTASIAGGGALDLLRTGAFTQSRGLYYGSADDLSAVLFAAAYAGRALSVNFNGSNTVQTMHLKQLPTIAPDPTLTETLSAEATTAGADVYASVQGVSVTLCSGANRFFDQVYNQAWFVAALQVAGFNYMLQAGTKIPQTEPGMDGLKAAYRRVCEQAQANQYGAPGVWTSPTTFGNQTDLVSNVADRGYYIYSQPVAQQAVSARAARQAPLVQIALKEAGAMHSSSVIVNVNQ